MSNIDLSKHGILACVKVAGVPRSRLDKTETENVLIKNGATKGTARVNKDIYSKEYVMPLQKAVTAIRQAHAQHSLYWSVGNGVRLVPLPQLMKYREEIQAAIDAYDKEVEQFCDSTRYAAEVDEARVRMGALFDPDLYDDPRDLRARLDAAVSLMPVPSNQMVDEFLHSVVDETTAEALRSSISSASAESLAVSISETVKELMTNAERVKNYISGDSSRFYTSVLDNITRTADLLDSIPLPEGEQRGRIKKAIEGCRKLVKQADKKALSEAREGVATSVGETSDSVSAQLAAIDAQFGL